MPIARWARNEKRPNPCVTGKLENHCMCRIEVITKLKFIAIIRFVFIDTEEYAQKK